MPCAFPVVVKTQVSVKKDGTVSAEVPVGNGYMANETVMAIAFGKSGIEGTAKGALLSLDKKLRTLSAKCGFCHSPPPQKDSLPLTAITTVFTLPQSHALCKLMLHTIFRGWQQYSRTRRYSGGNKMSTVR